MKSKRVEPNFYEKIGAEEERQELDFMPDEYEVTKAVPKWTLSVADYIYFTLSLNIKRKIVCTYLVYEFFSFLLIACEVT